jgi:hypothetical protein
MVESSKITLQKKKAEKKEEKRKIQKQTKKLLKTERLAFSRLAVCDHFNATSYWILLFIS